MTHFEDFELLSIFDNTLIHFETNKTTVIDNDFVTPLSVLDPQKKLQ